VAPRSGAGWGIPQRLVDQRKYAFHILINFIVPKAQYPKSATHKMLVTLGVASCVRIEIMLAAVYFDNESLFEADKIEDVSISRGLPAKMEPTLSP
jgi:hypothetical protein